MINWLRRLFSSRPVEVEVRIHVPSINVVIHGGGRSDAEQGQGAAGSSGEEEGSSELVAPPVSDEEKLDELSTKLSSMQGIAFGEEKVKGDT
jgi:hypothetical protein